MRQRFVSIAPVLAGMGALGALGIIGLWASPRTTPPAPAPKTASRSDRTASGASSPAPVTPSPQPTPAGPFGFRPISYAPWTRELTREARASKITLLAPKDGPVGSSVAEAYRGPGSIITIWYNDMIVMESPKPMTPYYQPVSSTALTDNGVSGVWDLVAGEGGPPYRLLFYKDGTYVRLELLPQLPDTVKEATEIASLFTRLG